MKQHKRTVALGITACLAATLGLSGCGGRGASESGSLTFWIMGDDGPRFEELIAPWVEETGVDVEVVGVPWGAFDDRITAAIAAGDGPDLLQVGIDRVRTLHDAEVLEPLNRFAADHPWIGAENYPEGARESMAIGDDILTVPWISDPRVLFYRSDILAEAGIAGPPATWDELAANAKELADRGAGMYGYFPAQWDAGLPVAMTWSRGGEIIDSDGNLNFDTPQFREVLQYFADLYESGSVPRNSDFDQTQGFISGIIPLVISGPFLANSIRDVAPELDGKWFVTTVPAGLAGSVSQWAGSNLGVWADTPNIDNALSLMEFLTNPETQVRWFELAGRMPAATVALEDAGLNADPFFAVYSEQLATSRPLPLVPNWNAGPGRHMLDAILEVVLNGRSINDAIATLVSRTEGLSIN